MTDMSNIAIAELIFMIFTFIKRHIKMNMRVYMRLLQESLLNKDVFLSV